MSRLCLAEGQGVLIRSRLIRLELFRVERDGKQRPCVGHLPRMRKTVVARTATYQVEKVCRGLATALPIAVDWNGRGAPSRARSGILFPPLPVSDSTASIQREAMFQAGSGQGVNEGLW
jgi:hypothetical protein